MTKNKIIIIVIVLILLIILVNFKGKKKINQDVNNENKVNNEVVVLYDNETNLYYIRDEKTNEIICASQDERDLDFYKENPDYNPNPLAPRSTDLRDYLVESYDTNNFVN